MVGGIIARKTMSSTMVSTTSAPITIDLVRLLQRRVDMFSNQ